MRPFITITSLVILLALLRLTSSGFNNIHNIPGLRSAAPAGKDTIVYSVPDSGIRQRVVSISADYCEGIPVACALSRYLCITPNASGSALCITVSRGSYDTISVADASGRQIQQQLMSGASASINISALPPGVYSLRLIGAHSTLQGCFVKQ